MKKYTFSTKNYFGRIWLADDSNIISYNLCHNLYGREAFPEDLRKCTNFSGDLQDGINPEDAVLVYRFARLFGHERPLLKDEHELAKWLVTHGWEDED